MVLEKVDNIRNNIIVLCHAKEPLKFSSVKLKNSSVERGKSTAKKKDATCHTAQPSKLHLNVEQNAKAWIVRLNIVIGFFLNFLRKFMKRKTRISSNTKRYIAHQSR